MPFQSSLPATRPVPFSFQWIEKALKVGVAGLGYTGYNIVDALCRLVPAAVLRPAVEATAYPHRMTPLSAVSLSAVAGCLPPQFDTIT